jgi:hypothetical protein
VPPEVNLSVAPSLVVRSPGTISGSLYTFDADGLEFISLSARSADSALKSDTTFTPVDFNENTYSIAILVPAGITIGTEIRLVARATDVFGFAASDTLFLAVQDTT